MSGDSEVVDKATLHRRARLGVLALSARTVLQQLAVLGGNVYLARILGPADFGAFWIVQFALSFFVLFGDAGFGAALIQKKERATQEELSSVFWAQMLLGTAIVLIVFVTAPWVVAIWADLPKSSVWMLRALSLDLVLTSMRVVPAILMERDLLFGRLSILDLVLTISFYGSAVVLALLGYGLYALVAGVLIQAGAGLITAYALRPWLPSLKMNRDALGPILRFGTAFQVKHIVSFINAAVMPFYAGKALGRSTFGLISWSQNTAFFPLRAVEVLARVNFPLLSRLQHDREAFARTLERTVHVCCTITLFCVGLFCGLGLPIVRVVYGDQWVPALPSLYVFAVAISIGFIVPIINGALDALGKPQVMMRLAIYWTIFNWIVVAVTMHFRSDALWFSIGYCLHIVVGNLAVVFAVKRLVPEARIMRGFRAGVPAALAVASLGRWVFMPWIAGPWSLGACILGDAAAFVGIVRVADPSLFRELSQMVRNDRGSATTNAR